MASQNAKYWTSIFWLESAPANWKDVISEKLQIPYCYCIHDKDVNEGDEDKRKPHVHLIMAFPNTTTYNHALQTFQELIPNAAIVKRVINIRYMYNYLIHDTDDARSKNKFQYSPEERITGNDFDIGAFEQVSVAEKHKMIKQLIDFIRDNGFTNMIDFFNNLETCFDDSYLDIVYGYHSLLEAFCRGNYLKQKNSD